ncbi:MAG TPA: hypothetical protein VF044_11035, partial [Actinomycetota bacterium]
DVSGYDHLTFRTAPNPGYWSNLDFGYQDLVVVLEDLHGDRAEVAAADVGNDVLRFPLAAFDGVDLDGIVAVELAFSRTRHGVIGVSDLNFVAGETG